MGHAVLLRAGRTRDCGSCGSGCGGGGQRCSLQGGDQCAHQHSSALLCTEILTLSLTLQHAADITQHGRHHGHGATQTHNTCQQVNTTQHVATCEHGGAATCRLLLGGVAPEVLRALVLAGAALPVGRAGGVRHGGAAGAARACWPGHWLSCSEQRWCQVWGGHWSLGDTVSSLRSVLAP